jgi:molybdate/tungstate transport system substrate-binding protein
MRRALAGAAAGLLFAAAAGCGSSSHQQVVSVLYAGSLVNLMEHDLGPAFARADGDTFQGVGAGSTELVAQIKGKVRQGDVFISASPKANLGLTGTANGSWLSWYITFAKAPLVLGYNPHSQFASQFRSRPWYRVITQLGIRVGRTDPVLDPKGKLTVEALQQAERALGLPALAQALARFPMFPEESLVGRLQSGQLDAGFFYANEATEQHIPTVALTGVSKTATYTVTILAHAPHAAAAEAFVAFLLGPSGRAVLQRHGLTVVRPRLTGQAATLPASLRSLLAGQ